MKVSGPDIGEDEDIGIALGDGGFAEILTESGQVGFVGGFRER